MLKTVEIRFQHPITLGRKNYLFYGNDEAAENMSVVCSLLATCKAHEVNPRDYLNFIIAKMPYMLKASHEELMQLLLEAEICSRKHAYPIDNQALIPVIISTPMFNKTISHSSELTVHFPNGIHVQVPAGLESNVIELVTSYPYHHVLPE